MVDFDWKHWFLTKKNAFWSILTGKKLVFADFDHKNGFWLILAEKLGFDPKKSGILGENLVLVDFD